VRIPLDYYRILGVPIQATEEQLKQAYQDRSQQLPRREYSEAAIAARNQLLELAYQVLSSPEKRGEYDARFLQTGYASIPELELTEFFAPQELSNYNSEPAVTSTVIEIDPDLFVGALLIFQELGEYELILRLGHHHLNSPEILASEKYSKNQTNQGVREDLILTIALAYLELGREQWQQGEYENAAISGQMGLNLLIEKNLFSSIQAVMEGDLYRLRPYRILELLAQDKNDQRLKGLQLLREMLEERQGIEGKGEDGSGLSFDHFLRYIQQLRGYLTVTEQQELFTQEAKRPSPVAAYLAVYTLLARGFAQKQPHLIVEAQQILQFLSKKQDVYWEQAVSSLLLGQTQQANYALGYSQEKETVELIRQYSQNSPDLLPGLCFYGEKWLQKEVLPQFKDLANCKLTLKEYFGDRQVQSYLEQLSLPSSKQHQVSSASVKSPATTKTKSKRNNLFAWGKKPIAEASTTTVSSYTSVPEKELVGVGVGQNASATSTIASNNNWNTVSFSQGNQRASTANYGQLETKKSYHPSYVPSQKRPLKSPSPSGIKQVKRQRKGHLRHSSKRKNPYLFLVQRLLFLLGLIFGVGTLGFVLTKYLLEGPTIQLAEGEQLMIALNESPIKQLTITPKETETKEVVANPPQPAKPKTNSTLTQELAQQVVQKWLDAKSQAFGNQHQVDSLKAILSEPLLSQWRDRAVKYQQTSSYRKYQHTLEIRSVTQDKQNQNKAAIEAQVREIAQHYQGTQLDQNQSYDDNLLVRYELIRQGQQWLIQKIAVVKSL
jgi:hypothetical protein